MARQAAEECEAAAHAREAESRAHIAERFAAAVGQVMTCSGAGAADKSQGLL